MNVKLFRVLVPIYLVTAIALPIYQYLARDTCVIVTSPATLLLYDTNFDPSLRNAERLSHCFCRVFTDADDELPMFLEKTRPWCVILTAERLNALPIIKSSVTDTLTAAVFYDTPPMEFDADLTVIPDYQQIEVTMRRFYDELPQKIRENREFKFVSGKPDSPLSIAVNDSNYDVGIVTSTATHYLPKNTVFYTDPGFLGLFPGIVEKFKKDCTGSAVILPIIKKM